MNLCTRYVWVLGVALAAPSIGVANPAAEVPSAFDEGDRFDVYPRLDYEVTLRSAALKREIVGLPSADPNGPIPIAKDLVVSSSVHKLIPSVEVGLFKDLSFSFALPLTVRETRTFSFDQRSGNCVFDGDAPNCVNAGNSRAVADGLLPDTGFDSMDPQGAGFAADDTTIFRSPNRSGLDQVHLGLSWAPMNQQRDPTKPTWKVRAELRLSVGKIRNFNRADPGASTGVSRGVHEAHLSTSMTKSFGIAEPYFEVSYTAPVGTRDGAGFQDFGYGMGRSNPQHRALARFGSELIIWENSPRGHRVSGFVEGELESVFQGRGRSDMYEIFQYAGNATAGGPLTLDSNPTNGLADPASHPGVSTLENFLRVGTSFGVMSTLSERIRLILGGTLIFEQSHLVNFEEAGVDGPDADDFVTPLSDEINPAYTPLIDAVGRRYRADDLLDFSVQLSGRYLF